MDAPNPSLPLSADYRVDGVCLRFEAAWKSHQNPRLETFLGDVAGLEGERLLWELLRLELEYRHARGEKPAEADYAHRFPNHADLIRRLFHSASAPVVAPSNGADTVGFSGSDAERVEATVGLSDVKVPGYHILAEVGRGGMGVVYKARHLALNRDVALKMILAGSHAGPLQIIRFRQEAETVARLEHPNIVQIYEVGFHQGHSYLALEFVAGGTLAGKTAGVRQPVRDAARLVERLAAAIHHAHGRGVVHRDLKPANILLTADGVPKITDFGLARLLGNSDGGLTVTNAVLGTPGYMAPEQAEGQKDISPATDVYALGAILYELLTGRPPFQGANVGEVLRRMATEEVVPVRRLRRDCPRDLETISLKCLQKDPLRRYPTADELGADLHRFLADEPIRARPVGRAEQFARWCRRNPRVAALTGLTALLLLVIAAGGIGLSLRLNKALGEAELDRDTAEQAVWDGKDKQLQSEVSLAKANRFSRRIGQRFETLAAIRRAVALAQELEKPPSVFDELRNLAISALALPDLRAGTEWVRRPNEPGWQNAWDDLDPSFRRYVVCNQKGEASVRQVCTGSDRGEEVARLPGLGHPEGQPRWSPDGRFLAVWHWPIARLRVWRLDKPAASLTLEERTNCLAFGFTSDGRQLLTADGSVLRVYELETGRVSRTFPFREAAWEWIIAHPLLPQVAVNTRTGVLIVDLTTGKSGTRLDMATQPSHLAWHPDGELLAIALDAEIQIWDVPRRRRNWSMEHRGAGLKIAFNPTGDILTSSGWRWRQHLWNPHTGREIFSTAGNAIPRFGSGDRLLGWSAAVSANTGDFSKLTLVEAGREYRTLVVGPGRMVRDYWGSGLHPNGRLLAVGTQQGLGFLDLATGAEREFLPLNTSNALFEPSGSVVTNSSAGLHRWPVRADPDAPHQFRIGPPERIPVPIPPVNGNLARSADGTVMAGSIPHGDGAYTWHRDRPLQALHLKPHRDCRNLAVSPDGKLVATGSATRIGIKVWDTQTGKHVRSLLPGSPSVPYFSPDGRWLMNQDGHCWRTVDWSEGPRHPGNGMVAFSPDGTLAAWNGDKGFIPLVELETGRELARLEDPHQDACASLVFNLDGTQLIGTTNDSFCVRVWDLRKIRRGLVELGLDWNAPAYPPEKTPPAGQPRLEPLRVELVGAEKLPGMPRPSPPTLNNEAWRLISGLIGDRNPDKAILLARQAVEKDPNNATYRNTLGVALYRAGRSKEAIPELEKSLADGKGKSDAFDLYFLAMCHAKLGDPAKGRDCFDRAVKWFDEQKNLPPQSVEELKQFRAEADAVLRKMTKP